MSRPRTNRGKLRIFVASLAHETNSFSPIPTGMRSFEDDVCYRPPSSLGREKALAFVGYGDAIAIGRRLGHEIIEGPCFWAQPSGPVSAPVYQALRDEILLRLDEAGQVNVVLLMLHGAMMAQGTPDCEGDLLTRVREKIGADVPIGTVLDLHGNVSPEMIASGAIFVGCKQYPHTDFPARIQELYAMIEDIAFDRVRLATTLRTIPLLSLQGTTDEPMRSVVQHLTTAEGRDGIRSVTLMHGFPWSDWEHSGASILIVSQDADPHHVDRLADDIADRFVAAVRSLPAPAGLTAALDRAMAMQSAGGPIVIADCSDNPGGGAAADSTFLLRELLARKCANAALGMICDPQAARLAADAGPGARLALRLGGKVGPMSGDPLDIEVEVRRVRSDVSQRFFSDTPNSPLGLTVALRVDGIDIIVNSSRQQVFSPECFTDLGVELADKAIIVVKSSYHFRANFDPIAFATITCNAPGTLNTHLSEMPYKRAKVRLDDAGFFLNGIARWPTERPVPDSIANSSARSI